MIRRAVYEDARSIAQVLVEAWQAGYNGILEEAFLASMDVETITKRWERTLVDQDIVAHPLVLETHGRVIGFSHFGKPRDTEGTCIGELYALNVLPEVWGRGFGSQILASATAELHELGYERAYLWVAEGNERASALYERNGWKPTPNTKEDSRFDPPLLEHRYERRLRVAR
ncbi:GNAT family N-acetyltransferase [Arthrobacter sp. MYb227]|uniref:GNAT family N-acetyltransferase n=1 Tax=Arthrobacter sp. MYb227 TaxID=1848601 RepID=UPI000CFC834D|nr:GNAT family N-acetyltransferase [Arthrobacter sp. MYb227]PQZ96020.1 GNAT family N-acetyltransferase [Arthrobacter sp. MYb227]